MTHRELHDWFLDSFGACGCGCPEEAATLLRDVLREFAIPLTVRENLRKLLPTDGLYWTYIYWIDNLGLTDHGTCAPGWLTDQGKLVLAALEKYAENVFPDDDEFIDG